MTMSFLDGVKEKFRWDPVRAEVCLRMGVCAFLAFTLSIAHIPNVVPQSVAFLLGLAGSVFATAVPTLMFSLLAAIPVIIFGVTLTLIFATAVLAAAVVSDGFFVAVFAVYAFWMTALYFGKNKALLSAQGYTAIGGLTMLSYRPLVQKGGIEVVAEMWTQAGVDNPMAANRNVIIIMCWACACFAVAVLVPPFRTVRNMVSRSLLPAILRQIHAVLTGQQKDLGFLVKMYRTLGGPICSLTIFEPRLMHSVTEDLVTPLVDLGKKINDLTLCSFLVPFSEAGARRADAKEQEEEEASQTEIMVEETYYDGNAHEWRYGPRLHHVHVTPAPHVHVPPAQLLTRSGYVKPSVMNDTQELVQLCSKALESMDPKDITKLRDWEDRSMVPDQLNDAECLMELVANRIHNSAMEVRVATLTFIEAMNNSPVKTRTAKEKTKNFLNIIIPPFHFVSDLTCLFNALTIPFRPSQWDLWATFYGLKVAAGYAALFCMSVYWEAWKDFELPTAVGSTAKSYVGWHLFGYAYTWKSTLEGTTKKGLQRMLGTCIGGFLAWLGIIVCSWSYDDTAEINPYGLVAWLTVTTALAGAFMDVEPGPLARMGIGHDHGFTGMFVVLTQSLIALEIYSGLGTKNDLVLNRIVASVTGAAMAIVMSSIPPFYRGGNKRYTSLYLQALDDSFLELLKTFASSDTCKNVASDEFQANLLKEATEKGQFAAELLKDATTLQLLPFYRPSEKLDPLLDSMAVTYSLLARQQELLAHLVSKTETQEFHIGPDDLEAAQQGIQEFLESLDSPPSEQAVPSAFDSQDKTAAGSASHTVAGVLLATKTIHKRLRDHSDTLDSIDSLPKGFVLY